jgi:hypothetical protein
MVRMGLMMPPIAERAGIFGSLFGALSRFLAGYCRYMGERDYRLAE